MIDILILVLSISIAVISAVWSVIAIVNLLILKKKFNNAIVVALLYKRSKWTHFTISFLALAVVADIVFMVVLKAYLVCACILVILISLIALLIVMMTLKYAILEDGIVIPYKFVPWDKFYDYKIYDRHIIFCGDNKGFDTLSSATTPLEFDDSVKVELTEILDKNKLNR